MLNSDLVYKRRNDNGVIENSVFLFFCFSITTRIDIRMKMVVTKYVDPTTYYVLFPLMFHVGNFYSLWTLTKRHPPSPDNERIQLKLRNGSIHDECEPITDCKAFVALNNIIKTLYLIL